MKAFARPSVQELCCFTALPAVPLYLIVNQTRKAILHDETLRQVLPPTVTRVQNSRLKLDKGLYV